MRRRIVAVLLGVALVVAGLSGAVATGQETGTVTATITGTEAAPCLTVAFSTVTFPEQNFSGSWANQVSTADYTAFPVVTNCLPGGVGENEQELLVRGTDATGGGNSPVTWALEDMADGTILTCDLGLDSFGVHLLGETSDPSTPQQFEVDLTTADQFMGNMRPGEAMGTTANLFMPCKGSDGSGVEMSFDIIFTAVLSNY